MHICICVYMYMCIGVFLYVYMHIYSAFWFHCSLSCPNNCYCGQLCDWIDWVQFKFTLFKINWVLIATPQISPLFSAFEFSTLAVLNDFILLKDHLKLFSYVLPFAILFYLRRRTINSYFQDYCWFSNCVASPLLDDSPIPFSNSALNHNEWITIEAACFLGCFLTLHPIFPVTSNASWV